MIPNPYACTRCLNLHRPNRVYSFRRTISYYLIIIVKIIISIPITSNPNTANMMNNMLQIFPLINGLYVCRKTLQSWRCDFPGEAIASQIFFLGAVSLHCEKMIVILKFKHPEWNFHVLQMLMVITAISLHFTVSPCHYYELLLLKYLLPVKLRTFLCIILGLNFSSLFLPTLPVTAGILFSNPKMPETMQQQSFELKYCCMGDTKAPQKLTVHSVYKVVVTLWL